MRATHDDFLMIDPLQHSPFQLFYWQIIKMDSLCVCLLFWMSVYERSIAVTVNPKIICWLQISNVGRDKKQLTPQPEQPTCRSWISIYWIVFCHASLLNQLPTWIRKSHDLSISAPQAEHFSVGERTGQLPRTKNGRILNISCKIFGFQIP